MGTDSGREPAEIDETLQAALLLLSNSGSVEGEGRWSQLIKGAKGGVTFGQTGREPPSFL